MTRNSFLHGMALLSFAIVAGCANGPGLLRSPSSSILPNWADPQTVAGDYLQGRFAASQQDYRSAASSFARAAQFDQANIIQSSAFQFALASGEIEDAARFAEVFLNAQTPEEGDVPLNATSGFMDKDLPRLTLVAYALRQDDFAGARALLDAEEFTNPLGRSVAHFVKAWAVYGDEGPDAALSAIQQFPESTFTGFGTLHVALMLDLAGQADAAEVAYAESLNAPGQNIALVAFSGYLEREKTRERALETYHRMAADRSYLRRVGRMGLVRLDDPLPGESPEFTRIARRAPLQMVESPREGAALLLLNYAWSAYDQAISRNEAAFQAGFGDLRLNLDVPLALAQLAVATDPDLDAGHYIIGAIAGYYQQYEAAADANSRVGPTSWLYNYAAIDRADSYVRMEMPARAIRLIQDYLRQDGLAPDVELTLADLQLQREDYDAAIAASDRAINIANSLANDDTRSGNLWRYYFRRGIIYAEADNWLSAEADLREALRLAPDEPLVLNYLGYTYVERGENLDEAFGMIERALAALPSSGAITDSLGWAHYQRGNYIQAVDYLEQAVMLEPGDDVITDHLGDAYWQIGRRIEARYEWRRVLQVENLDDELRASVEAKLNGEPPAPGSLSGETLSPSE